MNTRQSLGLGLALVWLACSGTGQSVGHLRADRYETALDARMGVYFERESSGRFERAAWPGRFDCAFVRAAGTQENYERVPAMPGRPDEASFEFVHAGITLLGFDRPARIEVVSAQELAAFLVRKLGPELGSRARIGTGSVRVRRIESAKLLVRVLGPKGFLPSSATAQSKTGQRVEIRPLADPTSVAVKSDLPLRVYVPRGAGRGTRVIAQHVESARTQSFWTDSGGTGYFTITQAGLWSVEAHHALRLEGDPEADWEIHTATLSFEVPALDPRTEAK